MNCHTDLGKKHQREEYIHSGVRMPRVNYTDQRGVWSIDPELELPPLIATRTTDRISEHWNEFQFERRFRLRR